MIPTPAKEFIQASNMNINSKKLIGITALKASRLSSKDDNKT